MDSNNIIENNIIKGLLAFNVTLLGNKAVGKTSILNKIINNNFSTHYEPTIYCQNYGKILDISENKKKKVNIMVNFEDM